MKKHVYYFPVICALLFLNACTTSKPPQSVKTAILSFEALTDAQQKQYQRALNFLKDDQPANAEKILKGLMQDVGALAEIQINLALSQYHQKKIHETDSALKNLIEHYPETAAVWNLAGLRAVEKGEFKQAEEYYRNAIQKDGRYSNAFYNMAMLQELYFKNLKLAVQYYQEYLKHVSIKDEETQNWVEHLTQILASNS